jgi:hypothetical protein
MMAQKTQTFEKYELNENKRYHHSKEMIYNQSQGHK